MRTSSSFKSVVNLNRRKSVASKTLNEHQAYLVPVIAGDYVHFLSLKVLIITVITYAIPWASTESQKGVWMNICKIFG